MNQLTHYTYVSISTALLEVKLLLETGPRHRGTASLRREGQGHPVHCGDNWPQTACQQVDIEDM